MHRFIYLGLAALFLVGIAALLLHTRQAPLPLAESDEVRAQAAAPKAPEPPKPQISVEQFRALGAEVTKELVTKEKVMQLRAANPESALRAVVDSGTQMRRVLDTVKAEPTLAEEAILLFKDCSISPQYPDSVRALCFSHYRSLSKQIGRGYRQSIVSYEMRRLADQLEGK
jgi:hypothetical protein